MPELSFFWHTEQINKTVNTHVTCELNLIVNLIKNCQKMAKTWPRTAFYIQDAGPENKASNYMLWMQALIYYGIFKYHTCFIFYCWS